MPISELTEDVVIRVAPEATLGQAAATLSSANVGAVVLGTDASPTAVLSERDVVRAVAEHKEPARTSAAEVATSDLVWCDASATVAEVAVEMMEHYVRHVLVEDDGVLVGVVSARDVLGAYAAADSALED